MQERILAATEELVEKEKDMGIKAAQDAVKPKPPGTVCIEEDCGMAIEEHRLAIGACRCFTCQERFEAKQIFDKWKRER